MCHGVTGKLVVLPGSCHQWLSYCSLCPYLACGPPPSPSRAPCTPPQHVQLIVSSRSLRLEFCVMECFPTLLDAAAPQQHSPQQRQGAAVCRSNMFRLLTKEHSRPQEGGGTLLSAHDCSCLWISLMMQVRSNGNFQCRPNHAFWHSSKPTMYKPYLGCGWAARLDYAAHLVLHTISHGMPSYSL